MQEHIETVLYLEYFKECKEYWNSQNGSYAYFAYIMVSTYVYIS